MFVRRTTYRMTRDRDDDAGQAEFEKTMRALVRPQAIDGLISTSHVPNDDGTWSVVAIWESKEHAQVATPAIRKVWEELSANLAGPPIIEVAGVTLREQL